MLQKIVAGVFFLLFLTKIDARSCSTVLETIKDGREILITLADQSVAEGVGTFLTESNSSLDCNIKKK